MGESVRESSSVQRLKLKSLRRGRNHRSGEGGRRREQNIRPSPNQSSLQGHEIYKKLDLITKTNVNDED